MPGRKGGIDKRRLTPASSLKALRLLALSLTSLALLALGAAPALAAEAHVIDPPPIGSPGSGDGQLSLAANSGLAINQTSHDIYVADTENHRVVQFTAAGAFLRAWGADVGGPGVNICTAGCVAGTSGSAPGAFKAPTFIAVDNSGGPSQGDVYVADTSAKLISKFDAAGNLIASWGTAGQIDGSTAPNGINGKPPFAEISGITVDSSGNLFELGANPHNPCRLYKFDEDGSFIKAFEIAYPVAPVGIAIDSAGDVYLGTEGGPVLKERPSGGTGGEGEVLNPQIDRGIATSLAVDPANDDLYVAYGTYVRRYAGKAPKSQPLKRLESFGSKSLSEAAALALGAGHGVFVAEAAAEQIDRFIPGTVPDATTEPATDLSPTAATLNGTLSAAGGPEATCVFQYVDEAGFKAEEFNGATSVPCDPAGPFTGTTPQGVSAVIGGLSVATTYHFRLLASTVGGANENVNELTFSTPPAVHLQTGSASNASPTAATLNGTIDPEGRTIEECLFEYLSKSAYRANLEADPVKEGFSGAATAPCEEPNAAEIGAGAGPVAVRADVSGLTPLNAYRFRLTAKNSLGATKGDGSLFGPPQVSAGVISAVTLTSAIVRGLVDPTGLPTTFFVQYVSDADFQTGEWDDATSVPLGGQAIGAGVGNVEVSQQLAGLTPLTTYHFRLVAQNGSAEVEGAAGTFTTYLQQGSGLPDGRAYEQATAVDKGGSNPEGLIDAVKAAGDGGGITFFSNGGIPGGDGAQQFPEFLATRAADGSGWSSRGALPPASNGASAGLRGFSEDLSRIYVTQSKLPNELGSLYQLDSATRELRSIGGGIGVKKLHNAYNGESADGSKVLVELTYDSSPPAGAALGQNTFVWDTLSGELSLAGALNDGEAPAGGTSAGSYEGPDLANYTSYEHAISTDGSRVFFTTIGSRQIYLRLNPTQPQSALEPDGSCADPALACTVQVSASKRTAAPLHDEKPATLWTATPDGSLAYFTSSGKLTNNATAGLKSEDLYRYEVEDDRLVDLTRDTADPSGADVQGVLGASEDGSYVYFVANGVLAEGAEAGDCKKDEESHKEFAEYTEGTCNLYLWHEGEVTFLATQHATGPEPGSPSASAAFNWVRTPYTHGAEKTARVSADGLTLLFRAPDRLSSYDNKGISQIYRYSAASEELTCISCNPSLAPPVGQASLQDTSAQISNSLRPAPVQTRNLSADGQRVFFETPDKLVAGDTNGDAGCPPVIENLANALSCQDVYEWEAQGSGSCHSASQHGGCLYLLSSGTSPNPSYFADASLNGDDAFLFTSQPLVGQDKDELVDIYDARVGGGIASQFPVEAVPCEAEACKPGLAGPPLAQTPASAHFSGPGNQKPSQHKKKKRHHKKKQHKKKRHTSRKQR